MVQDLIDTGKIKDNQYDELTDLIQARFLGEKLSPDRPVQAIRELGYIGTLGNVVSTVTQFGDLGVSAALKGLDNTVMAMFGMKKFTLDDIYLDDVMSAEFKVGGSRKVAKALDKILKVTQFKRVDKLGKETYINAACRRE